MNVCRRWRQIVFGSPSRLNPQIICTYKTLTRKNIRIWPAFPIVLTLRCGTPSHEDNAIAALEQSDRVCSVTLYLTGSLWEKMATVLRKPFPLLTRLKIYPTDLSALVLPDGFLGGSAPRLQEVFFHYIPFLSLSTLLSINNNLVILTLSMIPSSTAYISP